MMRSRAATTAITVSLASWLLSATSAVAAPEAKAHAAPEAATASTPATVDKVAKATPAKKEYKPPYPKRTTLFEPAEGAVEQVQSSVQQNGNSRHPVLLKGFVSFPDEPVRAVMLINDKIVQLAAGESFGGVQIVATEPPNATVKNDEKSWTMNLMKQPDPRASAKGPRSLTTFTNHAPSEHSAGSRAEMRLRTP